MTAAPQQTPRYDGSHRLQSLTNRTQHRVPKKQPKKFRVDLRKNRAPQARRNDLTRDIHKDDAVADEQLRGERYSGKGDLTRKRTIIVDEASGATPMRAVDESLCKPGRVLRIIGSTQCFVQPDGERQLYECTVRRMLRTLSRDARNTVVTGDRVLFRPADDRHGVIERVEPRQGVVSRGHQYREHILVANVTLVAIIASVGEPPLKPALIDRFLVSAAKGGVTAGICLNKCDLVPLVDLQPIIGLYSRLGYAVFATSTRTGYGIERLKHWLRGQQTVFAGQSGVGKSSLLNAVQPGLSLQTGDISQVTQKGRHTTRYTQLLPLDTGGWLVDTPGIRQMELWDVPPGEVEAHFIEFRPFVPHCKYPNCLHLTEDGCAVRKAVDDDQISPTRYQSYLRLVVGDD